MYDLTISLKTYDWTQLRLVSESKLLMQPPDHDALVDPVSPSPGPYGEDWH
jgi:hypothetical protein